MPSPLSSSSEDEVEPERITTEVVNNLRVELLKKIQDSMQILIRREFLFHDVVEQLKSVEKLCTLYVKYEGEEGEDFRGLTRDVISEFWKEFMHKFTEGEDYVYISPKPNEIPSPEILIAVGKFLTLGYIITGYLPLQLNISNLYFLLTGKESVNKVSSLLSCFSDTSKNLIGVCRLSSEFSAELKVSIANLLSKYSFCTLPQPHEFEETIETLAAYVLHIQPFYVCWLIKKGAAQFSSPLSTIPEDVLDDLLRKLKPKGSDICECLHPVFSDNISLRTAEERSFSFLESFIEEMDFTSAAVFMKFVSGCEIRHEEITVEFNGETNLELMIPRASTCGVSINISRFFTNQNQFFAIMKNLLNDSSLWKTFEAI